RRGAGEAAQDDRAPLPGRALTGAGVERVQSGRLLMLAGDLLVGDGLSFLLVGFAGFGLFL
ncbi:MAG: hypothetical protein ACC645_23240, partial [Pirellulales bacterium]